MAAGRRTPGSTSGGKPRRNAAEFRAAQVVRTVNRYATPGEGKGVVRRVTSAGSDAKFIQRATQQVRRELGAKAARNYKKKLTALDKRTATSSKARTQARKSAAVTARKTAKKNPR